VRHIKATKLLTDLKQSKRRDHVRIMYICTYMKRKRKHRQASEAVFTTASFTACNVHVYLPWDFPDNNLFRIRLCLFYKGPTPAHIRRNSHPAHPLSMNVHMYTTYIHTYANWAFEFTIIHSYMLVILLWKHEFPIICNKLRKQIESIYRLPFNEIRHLK
jgi:hypothetical protein